MKKFLSTLLVAIGAYSALAFAASAAEAQHRGYRQNSNHGSSYHHGSSYRHGSYYHGSRYYGSGVGVYFGAPLLWSSWYYSRPYYYDPYYYNPYTYGSAVVRDQPVYVEQQSQFAPAPEPQAQPQQQYWYFCQDTQTYYPHVQNCATPWQRVIPHAPR